ncbi:TPR-like protein [Trametopsis cervina]|nr:TPR-like protein [Trametopsis cervina]
MRLAILAPVLSLFLYGVNAEPSQAGELYPPGYLPLVNKANAYLSVGQFNDAAKAYTEALDMAPNDYLLYYKRATAYFSMNRHPQALDDFEKVLDLTSHSFDKAYLMTARIHAKDGQFSAAREAIKKYNSKVKDDPAVREILFGVSEAEMAAKKAHQAMRANLWNACVEASSTALQTASHSVPLRQQRADCAVAAGDVESAVGDLTRLTHLTTPNTALLMKMFRLAYFLLPTSSSTSSAMSALKQCLHYDPDSKQCLPAHRLVKAMDKSFKKVDEAVAAEKWTTVIEITIGSDPSSGLAARFDEALATHTTPESLGLPPNVSPRPAKLTSPRREQILRALCRAYTNLKQPAKGEPWCEQLLQMDGLEKDTDGLVGRGEALLKKEEWEEAVRVFEQAFESSGRSNRDIHQRLQRAQKLLKQSRQKDYYKVLDVPRDADTRTIKKAFRKAAMKAHPDKGGSEAKMATVNEAYEVLNNPELRQRYDNGDDPNDPTAGQGGPFPGGFPGGGGHPFAQFFQQGGSGFPGGGFQFHFG